MKNIAIFASGSGTNAENIINSFKNSNEVNVVLVLSNKPNAGVIEKAHKNSVPVIVFDKNKFKEEYYISEILKLHNIDWIILAGFLWLMPESIIDNFTDRIINIHPALLPKYGGKGMWGHHVHKAVVANKENETGITIHYVNKHYDEGKMIFQAKCNLLESDTADTVAKKIHMLEQQYFPEIILKEIMNAQLKN